MDPSSTPDASGSNGGAAGTAQDIMTTAKETAGQLATQAKDTATSTLDGGKEQATDALTGVADMLHSAGDTMREHDQDAFAGYADAAAQQVEQFVEAIRGRSVGDLLDEAERFARREPSLFLGGAFVLGIFGARFLKSGMGGTTTKAPSARSLISGMTVPGGSGRPDRVSNANPMASGGHLGSVMPGEAGMSARTPGGMSAASPVTGGLGQPAHAGGLTGGNLPAGNTAAAGSSSMGTAVGTHGAGADAPIRSGVGASVLSGEPGGERSGTHTDVGGAASGGGASGSGAATGGSAASGATSVGSAGGSGSGAAGGNGAGGTMGGTNRL
ncbi:MAG TPA: hypothetical protein VGB53_09830 [Rubricoccaceae bacterium]|jgi:hypothetical protein